MKETSNTDSTIDLEFLYGKENSKIMGIAESDIEIWKTRLVNRGNHNKVRFVSHWVWWDITVSESDKDMLFKQELKPAALYSHNLIWDESNDFLPGWSVKTSLLERLEEKVLFITRNTTYVLVGPGHRADITSQIFNNIHF